MKLKFVILLLLVQNSLQLYSFPSIMNPSYAENYMNMNGGVGTQGYWGSLQPSGTNVFSNSWKNGDYTQMYNLNSIAPYAGDRYTGYDSMTQRFAPQGTASNYYHPTAGNVNTDTGLSPKMADINSPMYRNFYNRYYNFFNKNLNLLSSKLLQRSDPFDFSSIRKKRKMNPKSFDYSNNYFDQKPQWESFMGANLSPIEILPRDAPSNRKLLLQNNKKVYSPAYIRSLKDKVHEIRKSLKEIDDMQISHESSKLSSTVEDRYLTDFNPKSLKI